jgi:hypothetical protein
VCPQDRDVSSGVERGIFSRHDMSPRFAVSISSREIAWMSTFEVS